MKNFGIEKVKDKYGEWYSPAMYTHVCGYKFCIGVAANGCRDGCGKAIDVTVWVMPGEYDGLLKWPAKAKFTVELIPQHGGVKASGTSAETTWNKPMTIACVRRIFGDKCDTYGFIEHSKLGDFMVNASFILVFLILSSYSSYHPNYLHLYIMKCTSIVRTTVKPLKREHGSQCVERNSLLEGLNHGKRFHLL